MFVQERDASKGWIGGFCCLNGEKLIEGEVFVVEVVKMVFEELLGCN